MKKNILTFLTLAIAAISWQNCTQKEVGDDSRQLVLPATDYDYNLGVKSAILDMAKTSLTLKGSSNGLNFVSANINNSAATLGRVLFYDAKLSINNTISCGSCHLQSKAFSDVSDVSSGFKTIKTTRNSMAITNPGLTNNLFWDSRSRSLNEMVLKPVQNHIEMGMEDLNYLVQKLANTPYYPPLFKKAFNSELITKENINSALTQFLTSMVTHDSKFDIGARDNSSFRNFSTLELLGKDLFMSDRLNCTKCHTGANFSLGDDRRFDNPYGGGSTGITSNNGTANVGLNMVYKDNGSGNGKFKIPSLRNIALTAPYMHDGRFKTLEEVVEHYNSGIQPHANLDNNLKDITGAPRKLGLSNVEKSALIAFLMTLSDPTYTTEPRFSDPFKY